MCLVKRWSKQIAPRVLWLLPQHNEPFVKPAHQGVFETGSRFCACYTCLLCGWEIARFSGIKLSSVFVVAPRARPLRSKVKAFSWPQINCSLKKRRKLPAGDMMFCPRQRLQGGIWIFPGGAGVLPLMPGFSLAVELSQVVS